MCPFGNAACINTSVILLFYRKWRPRYTWQPGQGTQKLPNICSRTKPKSMPRPRCVLEAGRVLGCEQFKLSEEESILMRGLAAGPVAQRFLGPMRCPCGLCFQGFCSDKTRDSFASELCFFRIREVQAAQPACGVYGAERVS